MDLNLTLCHVTGKNMDQEGKNIDLTLKNTNLTLKNTDFTWKNMHLTWKFTKQIGKLIHLKGKNMNEARKITSYTSKFIDLRGKNTGYRDWKRGEIYEGEDEKGEIVLYHLQILNSSALAVDKS